MKVSITDFQAFPFRLMIVVCQELKDLEKAMNGNKVSFDGVKPNDEDWEGMSAFTACVNIDTHKGVMMVFDDRYLTVPIIAHESLHALGYLFEQINQEFELQSEPQCYLLGWIVEQVYETLEAKIKVS